MSDITVTNPSAIAADIEEGLAHRRSGRLAEAAAARKGVPAVEARR